jgi:hypothetical protein
MALRDSHRALTVLVILAGTSIASSVRAQTTPAEFYGRYLEPPAGRVLQGIGNWSDGNVPYLLAMQSEPASVQPAHEQRFWTFSVNHESGHAITADKVTTWLISLNGRIPHVCIELYYSETGATFDDMLALPPTDPGYPTEAVSQLEALGAALATYGKPVFCQIGGEFNNEFDDDRHEYHPYDFPVAFRAARDILIAKGAKCAYMWTWEGSGATNYFHVDEVKGAMWYPGDAYVDWYGLDIFPRQHFSDLAPASCDPPCLEPLGQDTYLNVQAFLMSAHSNGFPVRVETSAVDVCPSGILGNPAGDDVNDALGQWFFPFFAFLSTQPGIRLLDYVSHDWGEGGTAATCWKDARITNSEEVLEVWVDYLSNSTNGTPITFLGKGKEWMLNDYYEGWTNLGYSLAGMSGAPFLGGEGTIIEGGTFALNLVGARPSAPCFAIVGLDDVYLPFNGGTMVPEPDYIFPLTTDPSGELSFPYAWPNIEPGEIIAYFQFWIEDEGGPDGYAASNALKGDPVGP